MYDAHSLNGNVACIAIPMASGLWVKRMEYAMTNISLYSTRRTHAREITTAIRLQRLAHRLDGCPEADGLCKADCEASSIELLGARNILRHRCHLHGTISLSNTADPGQEASSRLGEGACVSAASLCMVLPNAEKALTVFCDSTRALLYVF